MANLHNRPRFEASFRRRMNALSAVQRAELIRLLGTPPDVDNVPQEFWDRVQREQEEALAALLALIFAASSEQHGLASRSVVVQSVSYAEQRAAEVSRQYVEHSRASLERASTRWREAVSQARAAGESLSRAVSRLEVAEAATVVSGPRRDERVVVSETTDATTAGAESAVAQTVGISEDDVWQTVEDERVCPICRPLHGTRRPHWSTRFATGPPAHPGCRCEILYANLTRPQPELDPVGAA